MTRDLDWGVVKVLLRSGERKGLLYIVLVKDAPLGTFSANLRTWATEQQQKLGKRIWKDRKPLK